MWCSVLQSDCSPVMCNVNHSLLNLASGLLALLFALKLCAVLHYWAQSNVLLGICMILNCKRECLCGT